MNSSPGLLLSLPPPPPPGVKPPPVDSSSMLISAEGIFFTFSEMSFLISGRDLLLSLFQSFFRLTVTVACSSSILLITSSFSDMVESLDSISLTTASVFSIVDPPGIVTDSLNVGASTSSVELMLNVRLISSAVKKTTSVPIIVDAGFLIPAFRRR